MTCFAVSQEAVWLQNLLQRLALTSHGDEGVLLYIDSTSALAFAKDPKDHGRTKNIDIRYHYIRNLLTKELVVLRQISSGRMVVDPLTKKIVRNRLERLLSLSQETYIDKILERLRMLNSKLIDTPLEKRMCPEY